MRSTHCFQPRPSPASLSLGKVIVICGGVVVHVDAQGDFELEGRVGDVLADKRQKLHPHPLV